MTDLSKLNLEEKMNLAEETEDSEILRELAKESSLAILVIVAANEFTPKEILDKLSQSPSMFVKNAVSKNPSANQ